MSTLVDRRQKSLADCDTPLVRNCWYIAALADEVGHALTSRTILDTKVLLYRTESGEAVALHDRCPHRSYPLSRGTLSGDAVVCGYHGMTFGPDGRCVHLPASDTPATGDIQIDKYPLIARGPLLWIWMGAREAADEACIPAYDWMSDPAWVCSHGGAQINASYVALHENLLDLTHFTYLHADTVGTPEYARAPMEVQCENGAVRILRQLQGHEAPPAFAGPMGIKGKKVNRFSDSCFVSPGANVTQAWFEDPVPEDGAQAAFHMRLAHFATPISKTKFYYRWFIGRDYAREDQSVTEALVASIRRAFDQDVDALQAVQDVLDTEGELFREYSFVPDRAGLEMRRIIHQLALAEART